MTNNNIPSSNRIPPEQESSDNVAGQQVTIGTIKTSDSYRETRHDEEPLASPREIDGDRRLLASACNAGPSDVPQLVFALGNVSYDFGTEARRDTIIANMEQVDGRQANPYDPVQLVAHLKKRRKRK